jgi:hypothetical protein
VEHVYHYVMIQTKSFFAVLLYLENSSSPIDVETHHENTGKTRVYTPIIVWKHKEDGIWDTYGTPMGHRCDT